MDFLSGLGHGFSVALTPGNLLYAVIGSVLGTAIGVLPGLGPPATIALLLPATYKIDATSAVIMLAGIFYGAMYGGSTTSILLNIPGEAASVVTCLDGYKLARQGRAGAALGVSAIGSFIAGSLGIFGLSLLAPPLAAFALKFGPPEYFALILLGLMMAVYLSEGSVLKGLLMGTLGLVLGMVGLDPARGARRLPDRLDEALAHPGGLAPVLGLGGARLAPGVLHRGSAGGRGHHQLLHGLCCGKARLQAPGTVRPGGHRGGGRPRVGQQCRCHQLVHPAAHLGCPGKRVHRHDLRGPDDPWHPARASLAPRAPGPVLGGGGLHVHRQRALAGAEPALGRGVGEAAEGSV